jgi:hypothetical protein
MMKVRSQPKLRRVTALAKKKMPSDGRGISDYTERPIFFKTNSSIVTILELIRGAQCLIEVIRSSGEEM